jgi:hypothetical protein
MAVVYRHTRLDTNEVFYVGIGKNKKRSNSKFSRNPYWHSIVSKAGFISEVLYENVSWEDACELEEFLISLYGRKDLKEGLLANMTNGGEGMSNPVKHPREKEVHKFTMKGVYIASYRNSVEASKVDKSNPSQIRMCCNGTTSYVKGYKYSYSKKVVTLKTSVRDIPVDQVCTITGNIIKSWGSIEEAAVELKTTRYSINRVCYGKRKICVGYQWRYNKE